MLKAWRVSDRVIDSRRATAHYGESVLTLALLVLLAEHGVRVGAAAGRVSCGPGGTGG
jgi:hypothetical protein